MSPDQEKPVTPVVPRERASWTAAHLHDTLRAELGDARVVVVANRAPYTHEHTHAGVQVARPAGGLVAALEPVVSACGGVWVAHGSGGADRDFVDDRDGLMVPPHDPRFRLRRVWLSEADEAGSYDGFANSGLWPLCHIAHTRPVFRADDFKRYVEVNRRFAEAVVEEVEGDDDPVVLVQDYHLALAPRFLRARLPRATILTFWHVPWPNSERFGICPWREEILSGLLASDLIGFHTQQHCNYFFETVDRYLESRVRRDDHAVVRAGHTTLVRPYPISIAPAAGDDVDDNDDRDARRAALAVPPGGILGIGVDRLDYSKGLEERLLAVDVALERHPDLRGRLVFAQVAAPTRTRVPAYREYTARVLELADSINRKWGDAAPIRLLDRHHSAVEVRRLYRAADFCYVSSLHDGMNLVAKEFAAARVDDAGVLVLSEFAGAARELVGALVVNPYHLERAADAIATAAAMSPEEQRVRMSALRAHVAEHNVFRWAGQLVVDAADVRRRRRLMELVQASRGAA